MPEPGIYVGDGPDGLGVWYNPMTWFTPAPLYESNDPLFVKAQKLWTSGVAPAIKEFVLGTQYLGSIQADNPALYAQLKPLYDVCVRQLGEFEASWRRYEAGGAAAADPKVLEGFLTRGEALLTQVRQAITAIKSRQPGAIQAALTLVKDASLATATSIARGVATVGQRVIGAGDFLTNNLVPLLLLVGAAYLFGPMVLRALGGRKGA